MNHNYQQQAAGASTPSSPGDYLSTNSFVGGAQMNAYQQNQRNGANSRPQQQQPRFTSYAKLDPNRQQDHLVQQQQMLRNEQQATTLASGTGREAYQTTTPVSLTTIAAEVSQQQQQQQQQQTEQQQQQVEENSPSVEQEQQEVSNAYQEDQQQQQAQQEPQQQQLMVNAEAPVQVPILDQQSLISDSDSQLSSNGQAQVGGGGQVQQAGADDDAAASRQRSQQQPAAVYQVYQAYYAPKDHKPLPGYVRLSLDEFNELFKDAEIQFVDRNMQQRQGSQADQHELQSGQQQQQQQQLVEPTYHTQVDAGNSGLQQNQLDHMRASASDLSLLVDRRSISAAERRSSSGTSLPSAGGNLTALAEPRSRQNTAKEQPKGGLSVGKPMALRSLGQAAVKKIISIRNSRQAIGKQKQLAQANKVSGLVGGKRAQGVPAKGAANQQAAAVAVKASRMGSAKLEDNGERKKKTASKSKVAAAASEQAKPKAVIAAKATATAAKATSTVDKSG